MKKILAITAAAALTAGISAFAANPFSDVTPDDWAYQAVSDLSDQGVVEGYPDGTFRGERNVTRYEIAQIVARLMAKEDQLNAEQQATLNKLAGEYADELANLGVRVSDLEKKAGNIYWSGDARMQYQHNLDLEKEKGHADSWNARMRINVMGQVNDQVTVNGRFVNEMNFKDSESSDTFMDRLNARWQPGDAADVTIGRQGVALDMTGTFWDEDGVFDGIHVGWDNGRIGAEAGYGYFKDAGYEVRENGAGPWKDRASTEAWYGRLTGHIADRADISAFYLENTHGLNGSGVDAEYAGAKLHVWGAGAAVSLTDALVLDGDYVQTHGDKGIGNAALWTAGLTYGEVNTEKPGTWSLGVHYVKSEAGAYLMGNSALDMTDQLEYGMDNRTGVKFWTARAGVALQKNVELDAYYNFAAKASDGTGKDPEDTWGIELNYTF